MDLAYSVDASVMNIADFVGRVGSAGAERSLRLPDVQRPYQWTKKEVSMFCDSIFSSFKVGKPIMLGHVDIFVPKDKSPVVDLLDGQQRTTTIVLMLSLLRHLLLDPYNNTANPPDLDRSVVSIFKVDAEGACRLFVRFDIGSRRDIPCLEVRPALVDKFFQEYVIDREYRWSKTAHKNTKMSSLVHNNFATPGQDYDHPLIRRLLDNLKLMYESLKQFSDPKVQVEFLCHLTQEVRLVVTQRTGDAKSIPSVFLDANRIGLQLTLADQFKALLLKSLADSKNRHACAELWDNFVCEMKGYSFGLSSHIGKDSGPSSIPALDDLFTIIYQLNCKDPPRNIPSKDELTDFFLDLETGLIIHNANRVFQDFKSVASGLQFLFITCRLNDPAKPFDNAVSQHSKHLITAMQYLRCLARLSGNSTLQSRWDWIPIAVKLLIAKTNKKIAEPQFLQIIQALLLRAMWGWMVPHASQYIRNSYNTAFRILQEAPELSSDVFERCRNELHPNRFEEFNLSEGIKRLRYNRRSSNQNMKVCWFLQMFDEFTSDPLLAHHNTISTSFSIEHFVPTSAFKKKRGKKINLLGEDWGWPIDSKLVDSLGNLFLLSKSDNSAAGAKSFEEKLDIVTKTKLPSTCQFLAAATKWKQEDAEVREAELINIVKLQLGFYREF